MKPAALFFLLFVAVGCGSDSSDRNGFDVEETADAGSEDAGIEDAAAVDADEGDSTVAEPCIEFDSSNIDLGERQIGRQSAGNFVLTNCSATAPFAVASVEVSGEAFSAVVVGSPEAAPGGSVTISFRFDPTEAIPYEATAVIGFVDGIEPVEVGLTGQGSTEPTVCVDTVAGFADAEFAGQDTISTLALTTVELDASASASPAGEIVGWEWTLVSRPGSSNAMLNDNLAPAPEIYIDLIGTYVIELTVVDDEGYVSCEPSRVEIHAVSDDPDELLIRLTWSTPADMDLTDDVGADLDLHWRRDGATWNTPPDDIFWNNKTADWGPPGPEGNPSLDIDDMNGEGPENIRQPEPVEGTIYSIGVYYSRENGFGESTAVVEVYKGGQLLREFDPKVLENEGDFWQVAHVTAPDTITVIDRVTDGFP